MKQVYTNSQARLRKSPSNGETLCKIPAGSKCELLEIIPDVIYSKIKTVWYKIGYRDEIGYSYAGFFDVFEEVFPDFVVDLHEIQTADPYDAQQNIIWDGRKKLNMCGEIAVARIARLPLKDVLEDWTQKSPNIVTRIFKGSADRGTGAHTLISLLENLGIDGGQSLSSYFKDELLNRTIFTARRAFDALKENNIILGVKIGRQNGIVGKGGISHWVTLERIEMCGAQAICVIFNPYMNRFEVYSWDELTRAGANIDGVVVPRLATKSEETAFEIPFDIRDKVLFVENEDSPPFNIQEVSTSLTILDKVNLLWDIYLSNLGKVK